MANNRIISLGMSISLRSAVGVEYTQYCFRDVRPFLDAVENMWNYYVTRNVDIFKEAVSGKHNYCKKE